MPQAKSRMDRMPRPPVFATPAEERRHRKERLAGAFPAVFKMRVRRRRRGAHHRARSRSGWTISG